ncbi:hypothetical protein ACFYO0_33290 [Streptomyces sp. NPDC006365]|uniref:GH12 family glycosyl hydrolase domain-containing protein n=1 Tax=Streptomyces sp. NPDC006365 TaxID=3364744 RepID=UPI003684553C
MRHRRPRLAYDLWLHGENTADWQDQPTDEIMVWLNRQGGAEPLGSKVGRVSLGGAMWDIYEGDLGWKARSCVRVANTSKATLDLDYFTQALVRRKLLSNDKYVSGIEAGTEVFRGTGPRHQSVLGGHRLKPGLVRRGSSGGAAREDW